ncbi:putative ABC transport system ATP-binding protein [Ruminococcaceae bacterium KH2T8]|nr:putative ABC transport system ATP-binding protein [Ruminococcaceae bacterium KH2T8]SMC61341.1 putative ABC transport system ATP-binding protein [Oscillospiraceae bacterium]
MLIKTVALKKEYKIGDNTVKAVNGVDLQVEAGEFISIMGPSGCGKSTLLHLIGGLDKATSGQVYVNDVELSSMNDTALSKFRCCEIGFVFQKFNLINEMTVKENIVTPILISGRKINDEYINGLIEALGLKDRLDHTPLQLSGGQQQRVAIARALANDPALILCDEPTGNLDKKNSEEVISLLDTIHENYKKTIMMVTHDKSIADHADELYVMEDGTIQ